jgi:hypothetical protein
VISGSLFIVFLNFSIRNLASWDLSKLCITYLVGELALYILRQESQTRLDLLRQFWERVFYGSSIILPTMESEIDEIIDRVSDPVKELVDSLVDEKDHIPSTNVVHFSRSPTGHRIQWLPQPSKIVENPNFGGHPPRVDTYILQDATEWLVENHLLPEHDTDEVHREDLVSYYRAMLASVAGAMMDYQGDIEYSEEFLEKAFRNVWTPSPVEVLIPLVNFRGPVPGFKLHIEDDSANISWLAVGPLSEGERSAIYTHEYSDTMEDVEKFTSLDPSMPSQWKFGIKIPLQSDHDAEPKRVADRVLTALRLFQPEYDVDLGPVYTLSSGWITHRVDIPIVTEYQEKFTEREFITEKYSLASTEDVYRFGQFWSDLREYIHLSDGEFSGILTRLNASYQKESPEDQLVDCVIGFEESLLQGITQTESYRFRLPLRGSLLTERSIEDREERFKFFRDLYDARSMVVHENEDLDRFTGNYDSVEQFLQDARCALSDVTIEYMRNMNAGVNFDQTNQKLDKAAKNAEYSPDHTNRRDPNQTTLFDFA